MRVVATKSFAGNVSMYKGEEREIGSEEKLSYLLKAGYVEVLDQPEEETEPEQPEEETAISKKGSTKKAGAKNESK